LLNVELIFHLPSFIVSNFIENSFILAQIVKALIDLHKILGKRGLSNENISH
jgi:hypothetical protein